VAGNLIASLSEVPEGLTFRRGATGSGGHTSWSAKPELGDYVSLYGFMIHYLNVLTSGRSRHSDDVEQPLSTVPSAMDGEQSYTRPCFQPRLILAGYSYGSMIASHLPSSGCVLNLFNAAAKGSAEIEIRLRASHLSSQTLENLRTRQQRSHGRASLRLPALQSNLGSSHSSSSVLVGGFESEAVEQRIDRESRRSLDVRRSLDRVRQKIHPRQHRVPDSNDETDGDVKSDAECNLIVPQICYLLISPILPPIATFATLFSRLSFKGRQPEKHISSSDAGHDLVKCPSFAIYGSKDFFTSVKKLRIWAEKLNRMPGSKFEYHEVDGAGHFWHEAKGLEQMKDHIRDWECSL
jgi:pimeloyl-ACP methyl ester carboxylesterase